MPSLLCRLTRMFRRCERQASMAGQASLAAAQTAQAQAGQRLAQENCKHARAQAAKEKLGQIEQENHLAYLFRQAFGGRQGRREP